MCHEIGSFSANEQEVEPGGNVQNGAMLHSLTKSDDLKSGQCPALDCVVIVLEVMS